MIHSDESRGGIEGAVKAELNVESVARAEVKAGDGVRDVRKLELYAWRSSKRVQIQGVRREPCASPIEITYGARTQWGWEKTLRREIGILDGGQVGQKSQRCYIAQEVVSFQYGLHAENVRQGLSVEGPD